MHKSLDPTIGKVEIKWPLNFRSEGVDAAEGEERPENQQEEGGSHYFWLRLDLDGAVQLRLRCVLFK